MTEILCLVPLPFELIQTLLREVPKGRIGQTTSELIPELVKEAVHSAIDNKDLVWPRERITVNDF